MEWLDDQAAVPFASWLRRADEMLQAGESEAKAEAEMEKLTEEAPEHARAVALIELLYRAGLFLAAFDRIESTGIADRKFDCLIRLGRIAEANEWLWSRKADATEEDAGKSEVGRLETDEWLCRLLLAPEKAQSLIGRLSSSFAVKLFERAVQLDIFPIAEPLLARSTDLLPYAKSLYRNGFVMRSAPIWIALVENGKIDPEGYRSLGEILYWRGVYGEAASFFEYVWSLKPDDDKLRTQLMLANLRRSGKLLDDSMVLFPSSSFLREERRKVEEAIGRLEASEPFPRWFGFERMRFHA
ncbi:hypothetical protein [Paenibacillus contaminans]|uniref:hypothetical protein n=1 Tax=Paenibacillus contaminans TaxID=450362 RepID=UPI00131444D1|nr:hypothetical protein [Paenibacillus contaminans]